VSEKKIESWLALALLILLFGQSVSAAARTSLTIDEGLHITSGYSILRTGDYELIEEHPPLIKEMAALPLLLIPDLPDPRRYRVGCAKQWRAWRAIHTVHLVRVMKQWLQPYRPFDRVVYAARVPNCAAGSLASARSFFDGQVIWPEAGPG